MIFRCLLAARPRTPVLGVAAALLMGLSSFAWPAPGQEPGADEHGQPPEPEVSGEVTRKATSISRQTMSPFCPGRTLADCPSEYAAEWRRDIRQMVAEGKSASEIQAELESRVGGNLSGIPNDD
jgi:cytochrome c-type biogenesis protein CcmH/NrfF